jgi:LPS-assembly protein
MAGSVKVLESSVFRMRDFLSHGVLLLGVSLASLVIVASAAQAIVDKKFITPITKKPVSGTKVDVDADRITYDSKTKISTATGTVRLTYGPYVLFATKVTYDGIHDKFKANGSVELREPNGNILQAETADLYNKFKQGFADHVRALLTNDVTITADFAKRVEGGITTFEHASYTACKDCETRSGHPLWEITTTKTIHNSEDKTLYHYNPTLRFDGIPVAWLPYAEMPDPTVKRRSGFLPPNFSHTNAYGFGVTTPYFLELGPSADLTFNPIMTTRQGPVADIEYRKALQSGSFNVRGYGAYQFTRDEHTNNERWRGAVVSAGNFKLNDVWDWGWDGTLVSDKSFLDQYDFNKDKSANSQIYITGMADRNYFSAQAIHFQTFDSAENQHYYPDALPYVNSEYTFDQAILGGELGFDWSVYSLTRDIANTPFSTVNHGTDQTRAVANMHWQKQMVSGLGQVITPFARVRSDLYVTDNVPDPTVSSGFRDGEVTSRVLPSAGFDMRWPFMASYEFGQSVFTPVVQAIAATDETDVDKIGNEDAISVNFDSSSLFLQDRFTGQDRYEGGSRANVGMLYSFLGANGGFARVSLGESFHIGGENSFSLDSGLGSTKSDLVGAVVFQPWDSLEISYQARTKEDLSKINVQEAFANYSVDRFSGSLGYMDVASAPTAGRLNAIQQVEANANFKFSEAWSLFGGLKYDLNNDQFMSKTAGIAFDCDCMAARLSYTETDSVDPGSTTERRLNLTVELRTIGKTSVNAGL